jgi:hypothetical protein
LVLISGKFISTYCCCCCCPCRTSSRTYDRLRMNSTLFFLVHLDASYTPLDASSSSSAPLTVHRPTGYHICVD